MQLHTIGIQTQLLGKGDQGLSLTGARVQDTSPMWSGQVGLDEFRHRGRQGEISRLRNIGKPGHEVVSFVFKLKMGDD
jgi:hypothetical protein